MPPEHRCTYRRTQPPDVGKFHETPESAETNGQIISCHRHSLGFVGIPFNTPPRSPRTIKAVFGTSGGYEWDLVSPFFPPLSLHTLLRRTTTTFALTVIFSLPGRLSSIGAWHRRCRHRQSSDGTPLSRRTCLLQARRADRAVDVGGMQCMVRVRSLKMILPLAAVKPPWPPTSRGEMNCFRVHLFV